MKSFLYTLLFLTISTITIAQDELQSKADSLQIMMDDIEKHIKYKTGELIIGDNVAKINVPKGFKFLNGKEAEFIIFQRWGNLRGAKDKLEGLIIPEHMKASETDCWTFVIRYNDMGFVNDADVDNINYDELLLDLQKEDIEANKERAKWGHPSVHLIGWAQRPFYDKAKKILHWAQEISFADNDENTLNYNIHVLGRNGVLELNAIGTISQLPMINDKIDGIINSIAFQEGSQYSDFNPSVDKVADWTIGGLVAGKILANAGDFAFLATSVKVIFMGLLALIGGIWVWIRGRKENNIAIVAVNEDVNKSKQFIDNELFEDKKNQEVVSV